MLNSFIYLAVSLAVAQSTDVLPQSISDFANISYSGRGTPADKSAFQIILDAKCYGTNLRKTANPIGADSTVTMKVTFKTPVQPKYKSLNLSFPSKVANKISEDCKMVCGHSCGCVTSQSDITGFFAKQKAVVIDPDIPESARENNYVSLKDADGNAIPNSEVYSYGSTLRARIKDAVVNSAGMDSFGNVITETRDAELEKVEFIQSNVKKTGKYMALNGPLTGSVEWKFSNDRKILKVAAAFPGEFGYCGGFYSPLGLVFQKDLANVKIESKTSFKVHEMSAGFYWPNKDNFIHFLALDKNKDGKINDGSELFGDWDGDKNGFEALKKLDLNKDGKIDKKDSIYSKLILWNDKNADGIADKTEISSLTDKKIDFLSVNYSDKNEYSFGDKATVKQSAEFSYRDKENKINQGMIYDFWFSPTFEQRKMTSTNH